MQFHGLRKGYSLLFEKQREEGSSPFASITAIIAGNFGTGNITGMAVALTTGGPGALVWMWVVALLGSIVQFASCVLGGTYRHESSNKEAMAGPMYILSKGVNSRFLGSLFAIFALLGACAVGNFVQVHSITTPLVSYGFPKEILAVVLILFVGCISFGGLRRFTQLTSYLVPLKAFLYIMGCFWIIGMHANEIPNALGKIFTMAGSFSSTLGGFGGYALARVVAVGFDRGLFATDIGIGVAPMLQSSTKVKHPVVLGLVSLVAPVFVMMVCTLTGLVLLVTGAWEKTDLLGTEMVLYAFQQGLGPFIGSVLLMAALFVFSYTTILSWGCCAERAGQYLFGDRAIFWIRLFYLLLLPIGVVASMDWIWGLADFSILCMLMIHTIGMVALREEVVRLTEEYYFLPPVLGQHS